MSVPETNAFPPAPLRISTRIASSPSTRSHASTSASYISHVIALRASGRLNVRIASGPSTTNIVDTNASRLRALDGLRVLDTTQVMAGPFAAMLLADLGADVIKVEPPGGDSTRQMPGAVGTDTPAFNAVNRGKRSIVVDLKAPDGRVVFMRLARASDILIENYRPGVLASLGFDYSTLARENSR